MSDLPKASSLLKSVAERLRIASFGRRVYVFFLVWAGVYASVLLFSRFTGLIPDGFTWLSLLAVPALAFLSASLLHRRSSMADAARAVDLHTGSKDLFLTLSMLEGSAGEYKPLVARDAEERAEKIEPPRVVPFQWEDRAGRSLVAAIVLATLLLVPQFDPFGNVEAAVKKQELKQELADSERATKIRAEQIKRESEDGGVSEEVKKAIDGLKSSFRKMQPRERKANFRVLSGHQKDIGDKWKRLSDKELQELLSKAISNQKFGAAGNSDKMDKWIKELQEGSTEGLEKDIEDIQSDIEKLAKATDPAERRKIARELKKKLQNLENFASDKANSKQLAAALKRALKQLEMGKTPEMSSDALESMKKSLDLAKMELSEVKQSVEDLKKLEEALQAIQMAKKLNDQDELDGSECEGCQSMADYAELYAQMMAESGMGGEGEKDRNDGEGGVGRGGKSEEDDSADTKFKKEEAKSQVRAGKILLSLKTKGMSDSGDADKEYASQIAVVKQGLSEAIDQEQIPPGYVEGIKKYFDNIDDAIQPDESE